MCHPSNESDPAGVNREPEFREALCEVGRRLWAKNLVASNDGNLSFRMAENRVLCTPTMVSKGFMDPESLAVVNLEGRQVSGARPITSEIRLHLHLYRHRPDIRAVVHAHPPHATALAIVCEELPRWILPEAEVNLGLLPIAPYATPGTQEFADAINPWIDDHDAFLLRNHGAVTVGSNPYDAYYRMETVDQYCRILLLAQQYGEPGRIPPAGRDALLEMKRKAGLPDRRYDSAPPPKPEHFTPLKGPLTDEPKLSPLARKPESGSS